MILFIIVSIETSMGQIKSEHRLPWQIYLEDSAHVFWTAYPNPFSSPTIRDTSVGLMHTGLTFYSDLSDTVTIAFLGKNDSTIYSVNLTDGPDYELAYYLAGPNYDTRKLPHQYLRADSTQMYKLLLIVNGRPKNIRGSSVYIPRGCYCWVNNQSHKKN
jgi:hypothetical protein